MFMNNETPLLNINHQGRPCGVVVSITVLEIVDPGSTPGLALPLFFPVINGTCPYI